MTTRAAAPRVRDVHGREVAVTTYRALGYQFLVTAPDETLDARVRALLRPLEAGGTDEAPAAEIILSRRHDGLVSFTATQSTYRTFASDGLLLDHLQWHVNWRAIEDLSTRGTGLHATGLQRGPITLLCPAESAAGKSTLAAAMVRDGWTYLSDEAIECDATSGQLVPYPKPITLGVGAQSLFPEARPDIEDTASWHVDPDAWGRRAAYRPAAPTAVVLPRFVLGSQLAVEALGPGAALMTLAPMTFHFGRGPERNLRLLSRLVRSTPVLRLTYGDLDQAREGVEQILDRTSA